MIVNLSISSKVMKISQCESFRSYPSDHFGHCQAGTWEAHLFGAARFVVALLGIAHFEADLFGANFMKIIFSFSIF